MKIAALFPAGQPGPFLRIGVGLLTSLVCAAATLAGATRRVDSLSALQAAINRAAPGDEIVVANGTYTATEKIVVARQGTAAQPIVIAAESIGGVELTGAGGINLNAPAAYIVIRGFKFTHAASTAALAAGTSHCRITRNVYELKGQGAYLTVSGDDHEISYNTFQHKTTVGQMISVQGPGTSGMAQRTWIHHNYFFDFPDAHANNCSSIQVGLSGRSMAAAHTLVEHNLFAQTRGENENICNKSCENVYRYNTFRDRASELSLRHGNRCEVYGNFFIDTDGLRFFGDEHKIHSNYFAGCTPAIHIGNGDGEVADGSKLTCHDRPDRVQVVFNTLVDNKTNVVLNQRNNGLGATALVFANNLIQGGGQAVVISGPLANPTWTGNIFWENTGGGGTIPESGYTTVNPLLTKTPGGEYRLAAGSPAIGRAVGAYAYVTVDLDGQTRGAKLDVGADQFSAAPVINRILTPADVGPSAPAPR